MHTFVKFEGSMVNHTDRRGRYRKKENWLPFKNIGQISSSYFMCISYGRMCICVQDMKFL